MTSAPTGTTPLAALVAASEDVGARASRRHKTETLAAFLRALAPDEIALGVAYLSGVVPQGKTGIGYALLRDAQPTQSAAAASLTLHDVDAALERIARTSGAGSARERIAQLRALLARATAAEAHFLFRLLIGELRQGALEGQMIEAVAAASGLPVADVRRAAMMGGGIAAVAPAVVTGGAAALAGFAMTMFQPVAPMLAQPAEDIDDALARIPPRRSSGSSTVRGCRCTRPATTCGCTRAPATTSPPRRPRSWRSCARCPRPR